MLRKFIHKKDNAVASEKNLNSLPKTITGFYVKYAMQDHWLLTIAWAFSIVYLRFSLVLIPLTNKWFVGMFEKPFSSVEQFIVQSIPVLLLIVGINLSFTFVSMLRDMFGTRRRAYMNRRISEILTNYLHRQSMSWWTEQKSGKINSQINYVAKGTEVMLELLNVFMLVVTIVFNTVLMLQINIWMTVIFLVMFVARLIYSIAMMKAMKKASEDASAASSSLSGHLVDSLSNSFIVRLFSGVKSEEKHLKPVRNKEVNTKIYSGFMQRWFWAPFSFLWDIGYGLTILLALYLFAKGEMLVSSAVFAVSVFEYVTGAISNLVFTIPTLVENIGFATKAYKEISAPIKIIDAPNAVALKVKHGKIEFRNVSFKYKRKWILKDFNLIIRAGEKVGLVGGSGAGKTTLVNLLMRFYDVNKGQILIDGQDIKNVTQESLRNEIGFIPQDPTLFDRSLRDNISYGRQDATDKEIRSAAKKASADEFIMQADKKYDTLVGERGIKLSGGQKQRVVIARAFLKNAPILILDEATSALDSETEVSIQRAFEQLTDGKTTLAIAHRLSTLRNMDRIVVMKKGHVVEQGSHQSLLRRKGEYARLWKLQSGGFLQEE